MKSCLLAPDILILGWNNGSKSDDSPHVVDLLICVIVARPHFCQLLELKVSKALEIDTADAGHALYTKATV